VPLASGYGLRATVEASSFAVRVTTATSNPASSLMVAASHLSLRFGGSVSTTLPLWM